MERVTGREPVKIMGKSFLPERETAKRLKLDVNRLRRSPILATELRATTIGCHNYYLEIEVDRVAIILDGYHIRSTMKNPPLTILDRKALRETIVFGITAYPKKRVMK